jgi:hypothetical protein
MVHLYASVNVYTSLLGKSQGPLGLRFRTFTKSAKPKHKSKGNKRVSERKNSEAKSVRVSLPSMKDLGEQLYLSAPSLMFIE